MKKCAGAILAVVTLVVSTAVAPTAHAASEGRTYTKGYSKTGTINLPEARRCLEYTVSGQVRFRVKPISRGAAQYDKRTVVKPKVAVKSFNKCGKGRKAAKSEMLVSQTWSTRTCSVNLTVGVGLPPWNVSVGLSPSCKKAALATWFESIPMKEADVRLGMATQKSIPFKGWESAAGQRLPGSTGKSKRYDLCLNSVLDVKARNPRTLMQDHDDRTVRLCFDY